MKRFIKGFLTASCCLLGIGLNANAVTPKDFGAQGNVVTLHTCGITTGTATLMCSEANFVSGDVGKAIVVSTAGTSAIPPTQNNALVTTISGFTSVTTVTLTASAANTATNALTYYGTDDTAAFRSCVNAGTLIGGRCTINDGATFMLSNTASTLSIGGPNFLSGGTLDGTGTVIFAPRGSIGAGNDRFLFLQSTEPANPFRVAAGAIAKGATTFTAFNSADASTLSPGDWMLITEKDAGATDIVAVDWMQVKSIATPIVTVVVPFRTGFPNVRAFNNSGTPSACIVASPCGLSFRKLTNIVTDVTLQDFNIIVPQLGGVVGIALRDTRGVKVTKINCYNAAQNCIGTYLDNGMILTGNHFDSAIGDEFASATDATVTGNVFGQPGSPLFGLTAAPNNPALNGIDFGTAYSTFSSNTFGPSLNAGISIFGATHDNTIANNTFNWMHAAPSGACISSVASVRNIFSGNICPGGDGTGAVGIALSDSATYSVNVNSDGNIVWNNKVSGFNIPYSLSGSLGTDNFFDPTQTGLTLKSVNRITLLGMSVSNGTIIYCSDCLATSSACSAGTGALAKRLNGTWVCN
jgi:hypothetical protein